MNKDQIQREVNEMAIRLRLGEILRERDLTQKGFAEMSGISENGVSKIVNQPAQIKIETLDLICNTLQIEPGDLFIRVRIEPIK